MKSTQPSTPIIVPPTPSPVSNPVAGPSAPIPRSPSSASSSSHEFFFDADDSDINTKRRSMFRSPGTASSPDLATLVRKAKEKNGVGLRSQRNEGEQNRTPVPNGNVSSQGTPAREAPSRTRQRSSTTVNGKKPSSLKPSGQTVKGKLTKGQGGDPDDMVGDPSSPINSDWVLASPRSRTDTMSSKGKSSVRSRTSAFLGKLIGQGTFRDKSRPDHPLPFLPTTPTTPKYNTPSSSTFPPPVPPLPREHRSPPAIPIADVFSDTPSTPDTSKPLPPIQTSNINRPTDSANDDFDDDERSIVLINGVPSPPRHVRSPSPEKTIKGRPAVEMIKVGSTGRRRSMSVGDAESNAATPVAASSSPIPDDSHKQITQRKEWDTSLHGIMNDFRGQLSQLDPISTSPLDLKDPSTPKRDGDLHLGRAKTDGVLQSSRNRLPQRPKLRMLASSPTSSVTPTMNSAPSNFAPHSSQVEDPSSPSSPSSLTRALSPIEDPIVPPRSSSLYTASTSPGSSTLASPRSPRLGRPLQPASAITPSFNRTSPDTSHPPSALRDATRLRVQHRSIASSSEPSLLIPRDEDRSRDSNRTVRLVPSSPSIAWAEGTAPALSLFLSSQTDLTADDLAVTRFSTSSASKGDENGDIDIEKRGRDMASRCWREDEEFLGKEKIAEWLGGTGRINKIALRHYVDCFDFTALRLDVAFRRLCAKLYLKAETQQVDRILEEFSRRYWETNLGTVYGSASVVHAVSYSLLLLNTDLHVADLTQRMSRSQFVRNTLTAIHMQIRPNGLARASSPDLPLDDGGIGLDGNDTGGATIRSRPKRSGSSASWNSVGREFANSSSGLSATTPATQLNGSTGQHIYLNESSASVHEPRVQSPGIPSAVYGKNFDSEMEALLKEMYGAIKSQQILQPLSYAHAERPSMSSLSPGSSHLLRNRSQRSQTDRLTSLKRGSMRGIQNLFAAQSGASPYSSNSSIDGRISPAPSFAASTHDGFTGSSSSFLTPTLGFASNLSHTIIREHEEDDTGSTRSDDSISTSVSISDEELALLGPPWAKEGSLCRKQYWECIGKRAKSRNWLNVFVVIQKGMLNMFTFGENGGGNTQDVGGGNWLTNANSVGSINLAHCLAHALPRPGYNRHRPHCLVLTLATGGVYFFQAGTEELVNEWVATCNYWAARQSKEPLMGGVSNMEYGWSRVSDMASASRLSLSQEGHGTKDADPSDTFSMRSGRSRLSKRDGPFSLRMGTSPYAERVYINDWEIPMPSTVPSGHDEETQLEALQKYTTSLKSDLQQHNDLRTPMMHMYQARSSNANKALANWERKSRYLLTEIVKYDSYVDSLKTAMSLRLKKRGEKALEKALVVASPGDENGSPSKGRWKGYPEEATIPETEEPPLTPNSTIQPSVQHFRESAGIED